MRLTIAVCVLLCGCAHSSGVSRTGPGAFTITTSASPGRGGVPAAKQNAYAEANAACTRGLVLDREDAQSPTWTEGMAIVTLDFHCAP